MTMMILQSRDVPNSQARTFGRWLSQNRKERRFTMEQLAKRAGVSKQYLSVLERAQPHELTGKAVTPKLATVDRIAKALGVDRGEARRAAGYAGEPEGKPQTLQDVISRLEKLGVQHIEFKDEHLLRDYTPDQLQELLENISLTVELTLRRQSQK
jgi:transcriptional regulator with XRE-family HTH domain